MEYFTENEIGRTFVLRLDQGDYVLESIIDLIGKEKIKDAVVVSAIGTLDQCTLHMVMTTTNPPVEHFEHWKDKPLELSSIDGIIADGVPHLHTVVSDYKQAYSGHLEKDCRVLYLAEIVILEFKSINLMRVYNNNRILELCKRQD